MKIHFTGSIYLTWDICYCGRKLQVSIDLSLLLFGASLILKFAKSLDMPSHLPLFLCVSHSRYDHCNISQLHLIGFNTTCDFKKSQFANGLSCISLQQSHNLPLSIWIFLQFEVLICYAIVPEMTKLTVSLNSLNSTIDKSNKRRQKMCAHCS